MTEPHLVVLVGAGPAGLFAAKKLAESGQRVLVLNRDVKPGGLAEYGIFPTKHTMKEGLRKQFRKILALPNVRYLGNVRVGLEGDLRLGDLRGLGGGALVVAAGAQGTKSLGLPGEEAEGVFHAKDLVYHYNGLPPFSERAFAIGERCAVVGIGNVMVDVANYLVHFRRVKELTAIARRGPAERAYDRKEFKVLAANLDRPALAEEIERISPRLREVGQDPKALFALIAEDSPEGAFPAAGTRLLFRFLASPKRVLADARGRVRGLEVEENVLVAKGDTTAAKGTGKTEVLPFDTVVFAIGDRVDPSLGLPVDGSAYRTNPAQASAAPDPAAYEVYDDASGRPLEGVFVVGWARKASEGLVGKARQDGETGAQVVLQYLAKVPALSPSQADTRLEEAARRVREKAPSSVPYESIVLLEAAEDEEGERRGDPEFKWARNEEMLAVIATRSATAARSPGAASSR
jgi:ferredoxin--NADP+ reductase